MRSKEESILNTISYPILLRNTLFGWRSGERNFFVSILYFLRGIMRKIGIGYNLCNKYYLYKEDEEFKKRWLELTGAECYWNFLGAKLPFEREFPVRDIFQDTFYFYCFFSDFYRNDLISKLDSYMSEGPYGYMGNGFSVCVKENDTVIDAGAWIGDFSAYAAIKRAKVYAFESSSNAYAVLLKTAYLNGVDKIKPINKGLGSDVGEVFLSLDLDNSAANSISLQRSSNVEKIEITTIDTFVLDNNLTKVDFIKADIEGAEREMLEGAKLTLKKYAPKLAICTYHRPDDPEVLEKIILDANPKYKIVHIEKKLFAQVF